MLKSMSNQLKFRLFLGLVGLGVLLGKVLYTSLAEAIFAVGVYIFVAYPVVIAAYRDIVYRRRMTDKFLMTIATFGAFGLQDYAEALAVMVFYLIGEAFEEYATARSHKEIASVVSLKPTEVRLIDADGNETLVRPRKVKVGSRIRVLAGESIGLDGTLVAGSASVDLSALTGESEPFLFEEGQEIPSGGINMGGVIELIVTKDSKNSSITRLINLIEDAAANKSRPEALITRFAVYYTPVVVSLAVLMALVPLVIPGESFNDWFTRALVFLVISCPCALVLSVPLSFFGGLGAMSKLGVMVKGSVHIESMAKLKAIAFDKTGTITKGRFSVIEIKLTPDNPNYEKNKEEKADFYGLKPSERHLLEKLYALEHQTTHPIGVAITAFCKENNVPLITATNVLELSGYGMQGELNGHQIQVGKAKLITDKLGLSVDGLPECEMVGTEVFVVEDGVLLGRVTLADELKEGSTQAITEMGRLGLNTYMITGDRDAVAKNIAERCHVDAYYSEKLPENKLEVFQEIKEKEHHVAFVGDGINDAPTLASADVGIAMGQFGSASAVEAADVVVMNDDLTKISKSIELASRTYSLAIQNMVLVIGVKAAILILGALGMAGIWLAILGDVGLCIIAVLNAMRPLYWVKSHEQVNLAKDQKDEHDENAEATQEQSADAKTAEADAADAANADTAPADAATKDAASADAATSDASSEATLVEENADAKDDANADTNAKVEATPAANEAKDEVAKADAKALAKSEDTAEVKPAVDNESTLEATAAKAHADAKTSEANETKIKVTRKTKLKDATS